MDKGAAVEGASVGDDSSDVDELLSIPRPIESSEDVAGDDDGSSTGAVVDAEVR